MFGKTPITALQEYCAKKNLPGPLYEISGASDGSKSFVCLVEALDEIAEGLGRSKKEAKHDAAANIIKKLKVKHPDIENIPQAPHEVMPTTDAVADLRDLCIQKDHPLPSFEIVQQAGPPEAPEFTVECCVATIKRYATASTKKGAKQLAAKEIIDIIRNISIEDYHLELATVEDISKENDAKKLKKIKTYREYVESAIKEPIGTKMCDYHLYFEKLDINIRKDARKILNSSDYISDQEKAHFLFNALNMKPKILPIPARSNGTLLYIELPCDIDVAFAGNEDEVYKRILSYFSVML